jgi:hypothetical protein
VIVGLCLCSCLSMSNSGQAQNQSAGQAATTPGAVTKEKVLTSHASGTFEVKVAPQAPDDGADAGLGRMALDKQFHGDLDGTSKGQMLAAMSSVPGSGGYVAMERVTGTLKGKSGSFVLQHSGTMTRGVPQMTVSVVPDSGTEQLVGLAGMMSIKIADGKHSYEFDYTITETP